MTHEKGWESLYNNGAGLLAGTSTTDRILEKTMNDDIEIEELAPWLLIPITLIGALLRLFLIDKNGMWLDETFSVWLANHSVLEMLQWIVKIDQHPPLYYLLLHSWIALKGDTPDSVRLLSALFGAGTIPIIYLIGKRLSGAMTGVAAATLLALSPFNIHYAQDARMYTLLTFNAAAAIYALVILLTDPRSTRPIGSQFWDYLRAWRTPAPAEPDTAGDFSNQDGSHRQPGWAAFFRASLRTIETDLAWAAFIVFSAAAMLTHNTAVLFPLAVNIFVLGLILFQRIKQPGPSPAFQAPSLGNWVKAQVGIFILWSPWSVVFIQQTSRVYQEFWLPKPSWDTVTQALRSFLDENAFVPPNQKTLIWVLYALVFCLGLLYYRKKSSQFLFLAALFAIPFLGELIVSLRRPIFLDRTLIWITIPLFLLLAAGIAQLRFRFLIILALGILGTNNLFSVSDYYRFAQTEDWYNVARDVVAFSAEDDLVLFNATWTQIPFDYYFKTFSQHSIQVEKFTHVEKHGVPSDMFDSGILEPKMTPGDVPKLISLLRGHNRVWLIYSHYWYTDPMRLIPQTLASQMKLLQTIDYYGVQVQIYGTP